MGGPGLAGIHHLKVAVSDVAQSRAWYQQALSSLLCKSFVMTTVWSAPWQARSPVSVPPCSR